MLKRRLKKATIHERLELQNILNDIPKKILVISRAENQRKHRKRLRQARRSFYTNPNAFAKTLFMEPKSGKLDEPKEELENHFRMKYSDDLNGIPIPPLRDCSRKNFVFLFGALINLTVKVNACFHPIRMTYPIHPGPSFREVPNWGKLPNTLSFLELLRSRLTYWLSALFNSSSTINLEESHLIYGPLASILLDQGFPVEY